MERLRFPGGLLMKIAVLTGGGDCPGLNAGIREGWRGLLDPPLHDRLTREATSGILHLGGTILGTSRTNPFKKPANGPEMVLKNLKALNVGAVVAIGTEAIDRLHSTAEAHKRVIVCEVMGRHAGWIATHAGMAGGADVILIPERPIDIEKVCDHIRNW